MISLKPCFIAAWIVALGVVPAHAAVEVRNLAVEYHSTPIGIDVAQPRFSWQMAATSGERGSTQAAYRLEVKDPQNRVVWDSGRTSSPGSVGIRYAGTPLKGATRYSWNVTVWDQSGAHHNANSWFETGLMAPTLDSPAWSGAQWIGGGNDDLVLYAPYLAIFHVKYAITIPAGSTRASFVYGANDSRLMDKYKNIYQISSPKDASYIKLELDLSGLQRTPAGKACLNVYRAGYKDTDDPSRPLRVFEIADAVINRANQNVEHTIEFASAFGMITLTIDGQTSFAGAPPPPPQNGPPGRRGAAPNTVNLNPIGQGGDYLTFGLLCDIGFSADAGQSAMFRDVTVRHSRAPKNVLFREDLSGSSYRGIYADAVQAKSGLSIADGRYVVTGGDKGVFIVRDPSHNSMPMLRGGFRVASKPVESARLYVTARGIYEVFLNGKRVGDDHYNPGLTQYNLTHLYQTYDVTPMLQPGANALGAMLGEGWWSGLLSFGTIWNHFGDRQSLLAKLTVTYKDGTSDTFVTNDRDWKLYSAGPIRYSSLDFGEVYDSSREPAIDGWATAAYNDSKWKKAVVVPLNGTTFVGSELGFDGRPGPALNYDKLSLVGQIGNNAGVFRVLKAKTVKEVRPGVFVYNLGQNIVGVPRLHIPSGRAGARLTVRYAELLYPPLEASGKNVGTIMTENYRAAISQDVYTMRPGAQVFQPKFTSHGFQYIELTGLDQALPPENVEGVVISSVRDLTASYETSSAKVNQLWSNLVWSNIDNFLTLPTDCPQRNERVGWSGDISVFSRTATYVSNADQFLTRHMVAMRDVQTPAGKFTDVAPVGGGFGGLLWGSAGIVVPWETYLQYNDVDLLERHYPAMVAYMKYIDTTIHPETGLSSDAQLGDWLGPQNNALGSAFLATAYQVYDLEIVSKVAAILGKEADAAAYRQQYEKRKAFFNSRFVNAQGKTLGTTGGSGGFGGRPGAPLEFRVADTQTSYAVGLGMQVFNSDLVPAMIDNLATAVSRQNADDGGKLRPQYSLMTGFIGTAWISKALSDAGRTDLAYRLLLNEQYPSWLYPVNQGATSIWERLNGYTVENGFGGNNSMNSFNHYSFGAVGQWMMAYSLGIQRDQPGFQKFILQPEPDPTGGIAWAKGHYDSVYGRIESAWKVEGRKLTYRATVPANTTATLYLPAGSVAAVKEGGKDVQQAPGVRFLRLERGKAVFTLASGAYQFEVN